MLLSSCSEPGIGDPETQVLASLEHLPGGRPVQRSTCGVGRSRPPRVGMTAGLVPAGPCSGGSDLVALGSQALTFVSDCATVGPTVPGGSKRGTLWPANRSAGGNLRCTPEVGESRVSARSRSASTGSRADTPAVSWEPVQAPETSELVASTEDHWQRLGA